jgi:hypothetical protein
MVRRCLQGSARGQTLQRTVGGGVGCGRRLGSGHPQQGVLVPYLAEQHGGGWRLVLGLGERKVAKLQFG